MVKTLAPPTASAPTRAAGPRPWTAAEVGERFGGIPPGRVVLDPAPGTATADDIEGVKRRTGRVCELIDGTLIEKAVSAESELIAGRLLGLFLAFVDEWGLGWVLGGQGFLRLSGRRLRAADVAVVLYGQVEGEHFPGPSNGGPAYPDLYPDLAVEVLSPSNTAEEMRLKRADCFGAGTSLIWEIDPVARTAAVYTSVEEPDERLGPDDALDGRDVLPGFRVHLRDLLAAVRKRPARD